MNSSPTLKLSRTDFLETGIFGILSSDDTLFSCYTLEHAYPDQCKPPLYFPKIPKGTYTCIRGMHQLEGMKEPFETFEVMNVPGHTNILFHSGNLNADSAGCILLGLQREGNLEILDSRSAFEVFMGHLSGYDSFQLLVLSSTFTKELVDAFKKVVNLV